MSTETALDIPKRKRGNPNWVKGTSGNPTGKRKLWSDTRYKLSRMEQKARRRLARLIDSDDDATAFQAVVLFYSYTLGKPVDGDILARMDEMISKRLEAFRASDSTIEAALPEPKPTSVMEAPSLPPEAADVSSPVHVDAPAVSAPPVSRCHYRLQSGQCEAEAMDGKQWCAVHHAKLFAVLEAK